MEGEWIVRLELICWLTLTLHPQDELEEVYQEIKARVLKEQAALRDEGVASLDQALAEVSLDKPEKSDEASPTSGGQESALTSSADPSSELSTGPSSDDAGPELASKLDALALAKEEEHKKSEKKSTL